MKVYIGPHIDWIGPYQIAEKLMFWEDKYDENYNSNDKIHKFGTWLAETKDGKDTWLMKICNWWHNKQKRKVKIHIDNYDAWNAHNTASMILLPLFTKLKETKHGSGFIDDEDVPEWIRSTSPKAWTGISEESKSNQCSDNFIDERYNWVLNEILWALQQDQPDCDWEDKYWKVHPELDLTKHPEDEGKKFIPIRWNVEGECDWDGRKEHQKRIDNGFRLMGKYWCNLWD